MTMRKIDIPAFRKEVMAIIEANRKKVTSLEAADDNSIFTFCGKNYACEITLNEKWIGIDLGIDTPDNNVGCGYESDTDLYALDFDEKVTLEIYDDLLSTVKAIFAGKVYLTSNEKFSYTAIENEKGTYKVRYWERKKFLFWSYMSGWWKDDFSESEFKKLKLNVLT